METVKTPKTAKSTKAISKAIAKPKAEAIKAKSTAKVAVKATETPQERNYRLDVADLKEIKAEKSLAAAYNKGSYHFSISALELLGKNRWHTLADFRTALSKAMGKDEWKAFETKKARNENGLDCNGRILQNLLVLQRVKDYGLKLLQVGAVIDLRRNDKNKGEVRLNTQSKEPLKLGRKVESK